jgi:hypothetical protein
VHSFDYGPLGMSLLGPGFFKIIILRVLPHSGPQGRCIGGTLRILISNNPGPSRDMPRIP